MNAMRKEEMAQTMDPEKLKIHEWVSERLILIYITIFLFAIANIHALSTFISFENFAI